MATNKQTTKSLARLAKHVDECLKLVTKAEGILGVDTPALSSDERRRLLKAKVGGEKHLPTIARLGKEHGLDLDARPIDAMLESAARVKTLEPLRESLRVCLQKVDDAMAIDSGEWWQTATLVYTMLRRLSRTDAKLALQLEPLTAFFRKKPAGQPSGAADAPKGTPASAQSPAE